jgi:predicted nucleic acid-binding protein
VIVVDASVAVQWFLADEAGSAAGALAESALEFVSKAGALVPGNFHGEVTNALLKAERRGRLDRHATTTALAELLALGLTVAPPDAHLVLATARDNALSCYDASYLALALQTHSPLATLGAKLGDAAARMKVLWRP